MDGALAKNLFGVKVFAHCTCEKIIAAAAAEDAPQFAAATGRPLSKLIFVFKETSNPLGSTSKH